VVNQRYISAWEKEQDFWWQIAWRIPDLKADSFILVDGTQPLAGLDRELAPWAISNPLSFIYKKQTFGGESLNAQSAGKMHADGFTPQIGSGPIDKSRLIVVEVGNGCVKIADERRQIQDSSSEFFNQFAAFSSSSNILYEAPPSTGSDFALLTGQPSLNWCYYYQRAEYFVAIGEWANTIQLLSDSKSLTPLQDIEWSPFIEAYLHLGKIQEIQPLIRKISSAHLSAIQARVDLVEAQASKSGDSKLVSDSELVKSMIHEASAF
jgi:hypothetical protein